MADQVLLDISFAAARSRMASLTRGGLLVTASDGAYGEGITGLMRVGTAGVSRLVRVQFSDLPDRPDTVGLAVRWEVTGPGGALFPVLDADGGLGRAMPQATWLTLAGAYRPPLGPPGDALDRAILHRVARATIRGFISRLAAVIAHPGAAAARGCGHQPARQAATTPGALSPGGQRSRAVHGLS